MAHRIRKLQAKLAPDVDVDDYVLCRVPDRPKGMRQASYRRLADRLEMVYEKYDAYLEQGLWRPLAQLAPDDELDDLFKGPT